MVVRLMVMIYHGIPMRKKIIQKKTNAKKINLKQSLRIRLYVRLERDCTYIPILFGWDWKPQSYSIGRGLDPTF